MPINISRGSLPRQANVPRTSQIATQRIPRIAEVFEDLATESTVELIVYENFLDLNPQVRRFPNINTSQPINTGEQRVDNNIIQETLQESSGDTRPGIRRQNRRDIIRGYRVR